MSNFRVISLSSFSRIVAGALIFLRKKYYRNLNLLKRAKPQKNSSKLHTLFTTYYNFVLRNYSEYNFFFQQFIFIIVLLVNGYTETHRSTTKILMSGFKNLKTCNDCKNSYFENLTSKQCALLYTSKSESGEKMCVFIPLYFLIKF